MGYKNLIKLPDLKNNFKIIIKIKNRFAVREFFGKKFFLWRGNRHSSAYDNPLEIKNFHRNYYRPFSRSLSGRTCL